MSGDAIAGILAGTAVEVCSLERTADGGLLAGLVTHPPSWVCILPSEDADRLEQTWQGDSRVAIPMPPPRALMYEQKFDA